MKTLIQKEDYWAIWLGFLLLLIITVLFLSKKPDAWDQLPAMQEKLSQENKAPFKTLAWYTIYDQQRKVKSSSTATGKWLKKVTSKTSKWKSNPLNALIITESSVASKKEKLALLQEAKEKEQQLFTIAQVEEAKALEFNYKDKSLNEKASLAIADWRKQKENRGVFEKKYSQKPVNRVYYFLLLFCLFLLLFGIANHFMGVSFLRFSKAFAIIFSLSVLAYIIGSQSAIKAHGLGYAFWAILIGLLISNTIGTPKSFLPALSTEFYIKTGLVLLGAEILLTKVAAIGLPGIFVAWFVTPVVLISTYWFGQKVLKISSKTLNITICADMSVCGVSAAVATAAACKAKKEELTLAVGLSMVFTSIMMIVLPLFINKMGMSEVLGGAWIGGTIDATGAVVAAGAFLGDKALNVAATIKMIQNILIGIVAFFVAIYFSKKSSSEASKIGWQEIFKRFPKFILGFFGASLIFSLFYYSLGDAKAYTLIDQGVLSITKNLRGWCFCLAFISIGLSTNFRELKEYFKEGKPLILYLVGQTFNLILTLLVAYVVFYLIFPSITSQI